LGEEGFSEKFKEILSDKELMREIPRGQRYVGRPELKSLFREKDQRRNDALMHQAHVRFGYTLKEIADYLGLHYTTVSRIVKRYEEKN
jgi:putative transposase